MAHENAIDAIVNQTLEEFHVPGAAIAVVIEDKVILCRGYGLRDRENNLPVTENTLFPICSNTKAFTSCLIGQLVEEGKLAWDDPVLKYLPEFRLYNDELSSQVTLRDLIAHRTGIPRHDVLWYCVRDLTEDDVLQALPHFPPVFNLRETFLYNNFMYVVAGKVINRVTGNSWEEELASRILKPLEMDRTGTSNRFLEMPDIAHPYAEIGGKIQKLSFLYPCSTIAASAIQSSASDMVKWVRTLLFDKTAPRLIQRETLNEMHRVQMPFEVVSPQEVHLDGQPGYGLGWIVDAYRGQKQVHHGGTLEGFFSDVFLFPADKIGIVILTNSSTDGRDAITCIKNSIYDYLLGIQDTNWLRKLVDERASMNQKPNTSLQKYEGHYGHSAYGLMQVALEYDSLVATLGKMRVQLNQKSENLFEARFPCLLAYGVNPIVEFSFFTNALGAVDELHVPFEHFRSAPAIIFKKQYKIRDLID